MGLVSCLTTFNSSIVQDNSHFFLFIHSSLIPINQIGQSSPMVVNVFLAISKLAIPPIACLLWAKYELGSDRTISIPSASLLSAYAILNPQKSLNIASTLPNCASIWTRFDPNDLAKSECHLVFSVVDVRQRFRSFRFLMSWRDKSWLSLSGCLPSVPVGTES